MTAAPFPDRERIDASEKVRGATAYAADLHLPRLLYASGKMIAAHYHVEQQNSRAGAFPASQYHEGAIRLYGIANYHGTAANIRLDTQPPGAHARALRTPPHVSPSNARSTNWPTSSAAIRSNSGWRTTRASICITVGRCLRATLMNACLKAPSGSAGRGAPRRLDP